MCISCLVVGCTVVNFSDFVMRKEDLSTVKMSDTKVTCWWQRRTSGGTVKLGVGMASGLCRTVLPFRLATLGPKMVSAFSTSRLVTGRLRNTLLSTALRKEVSDYPPAASCICRAKFVA